MLFTTWFEHHGAAGNVRGQMILGVFCNNLGVAKWFFYTMDGLVRGYDKPIHTVSGILKPWWFSFISGLQNLHFKWDEKQQGWCFSKRIRTFPIAGAVASSLAKYIRYEEFTVTKIKSWPLKHWA